MSKVLLIMLATVLTTCLSLTVEAQTQIQVTGYDSDSKTASEHYRYLFENERFVVPIQEVEFDSNGHGKFRFKKKGSEEIVNKIKVSSAVLDQVKMLFGQLNFLDSTDDYQHRKDFSHLGNMTISMTRGGKERTVKYNYTSNQALNQLSEIFRNIATQENRYFELETILQNDPLSMPAQLRFLESELKSKRVADPQRFVPFLQELKLDEAVPLIARNHAERLLQMINKNKK